MPARDVERSGYQKKVFFRRMLWDHSAALSI